MLQKQNFILNFLKGINVKNDEKQNEITAFLNLENCVFNKLGEITKRYGYNKLSLNQIGGNTVSAAVLDADYKNKGLAKFKEQLLLKSGENGSMFRSKLYSLDEKSGDWKKVGNGNYLPVSVEQFPLSRNLQANVFNSNSNLSTTQSNSISGYDLSTQSSYTLFVFTTKPLSLIPSGGDGSLENFGGVTYYSIIDNKTNSFIAKDIFLTNNSGTYGTKLFYKNGTYFVFSGNNCFKINQTTPSSFTTISIGNNGSGLLQVSEVVDNGFLNQFYIIANNPTNDTECFVKKFDYDISPVSSNWVQVHDKVRRVSAVYNNLGSLISVFDPTTLKIKSFNFDKQGLADDGVITSNTDVSGTYPDFISMNLNSSFNKGDNLFVNRRGKKSYTDNTVQKILFPSPSQTEQKTTILDGAFMVSNVYEYDEDFLFVGKKQVVEGFDYELEITAPMISGNIFITPGENPFYDGQAIVLSHPNIVGTNNVEVYYVVDRGVNTFKLSSTYGGSALSFSSIVGYSGGWGVAGENLKFKTFDGTFNSFSNYYIFDDSGNIVGKLYENEASISQDNFELSTLNLCNLHLDITVNKLICCLPVNSEKIGVNKRRELPDYFLINLEEDQNFNNKETDGGLYVAGSSLRQYDGSKFFNCGFDTFPVNSYAGQGNTFFDIPVGNYGLAIVYSYKDLYGNKHRSAPYFFNINLQTKGSIDVIAQYLKTDEKNNYIDISYEIYLTEDSGTIYYLVEDIVVLAVTNDYLIFTIRSLENLLLGEILYTTGDILESGVTESCKYIETFKDRIFYSGLKNTNRIFFSKLKEEGIAYEFNETLYLDLPEEGGPITGLKAMDDKLVAFKEDRIYIIYGNGPNNAGAGANYEYQLISSDLGCINARSIELTDAGVIFQSNNGLHILGRGMQTQYVGLAIESLVKSNPNISATISVPDRSEVWVLTSGNLAFILNTITYQWSVFTNTNAVFACLWKNKVCKVNSVGQVVVESNGFVDPDNTYIPIKIETSWFNFAGIKNYQRVYNFQMIGTSHTSHNMQITVFNNFSNVASQSITYNDLGGNTVYNKRFNLKVQKSTSMKLVFQEQIPSPAVRDKGFSLSALNLELGIKKGQQKIKGS